jgi:hypothetical protein
MISTIITDVNISALFGALVNSRRRRWPVFYVVLKNRMRTVSGPRRAGPA